MKKANFALQHLRTDFRSMIGEECLNALSLACIHQDIFHNHDKMHPSKYPKQDAFN